MNDVNSRAPEPELLPLTDSLASLVRWRVSDYAAIIRAELELMLGADADDGDSASERTSISTSNAAAAAPRRPGR